MIAVSVSLPLLLVLAVVTGVVVCYGCYIRGLAAGKENEPGSDEYLTCSSPAEIRREIDQNRAGDTVFTVKDQSNTSSMYETPNFYERPVSSYAGLQQCENANRLFTMDSAELSQEAAALAGRGEANGMASTSRPGYVQSGEYEDVGIDRPATYIDKL